MLVSFIVPVYNIEDYISKCIDSILSLKAVDIEIILVVGNSKDNSNYICSRYSSKYENVSIVTQFGSGLSNARNCGMSIARGDYVLFIDGDDYIISNKLDILLLEISEKRPDLVISDCIVEDSTSGRKHTTKTSFANIRYNFWNVWKYVFSRRLLFENRLEFIENMKAEDILFSTTCLLHAKTILKWNDAYYCYTRYRNGSLQNDKDISNIKDTVELLEEALQKLNGYSNLGILYKQIPLMRRRLKLEYLYMFRRLLSIPSNQKNAAKKIILAHRQILEL